MQQAEVKRLAQKGAMLAENSDVLFFNKIGVEGLATPTANISVFIQSRGVEIACTNFPTAYYEFSLPAHLHDYNFDENRLVIEIRGGDGRRMREFDSDWWPFVFTRRYDYERMAAVICYFCTNPKAGSDIEFTTDIRFVAEPDIKSLDDAPLLIDVKKDEYSLSGNLVGSNILNIQFMKKPTRFVNNIGGYVGIQRGKVVEQKSYSQYSNCKFSIYLGDDSYQIKLDDESGESEIWTLSSQRDMDIALQCFNMIFGFMPQQEQLDNGTLCPVCKRISTQSDVCLYCGFTQLAPTFISKADAEDWMNNIVIPFRSKWLGNS